MEKKLQRDFLKFTSHEFKKMLLDLHPDLLILYEVKASNKEYEYWQKENVSWGQETWRE